MIFVKWMNAQYEYVRSIITTTEYSSTQPLIHRNYWKDEKAY